MIARSLGWLAIVALCGCLDRLAPDVGPLVRPDPTGCNADSDPATTVTFAADIQPILARSCTRCHRAGQEGQQQSGLDLSTYDSLRAGGDRSVTTIVVVGQPCSSVLYQKVTSAPPFGATMPRGQSLLATNEQTLIHDWIAEGALND